MATDNINPNYPGLDSALAAGQRITTRSSTFLASASAGAIIATLVDPFGAGSTYATVGTVPAQLALAGANVVKGSGVAFAGVDYKLRVLATSADGLRDTSSILTFTATSAAPVVSPNPGPTLGVLTLVGTLTQGVATSGVTITGATAGSTITLNVAGLTVTGSGSTRTVSGTPSASGTLNATEALAGAVNTPRSAAIGTVSAVPLTAPLAPTVTSTDGMGQARLAITNDAASQGVQKYGIYRSAAAGGTKTFLAWAYRRHFRRTIANGSSEFFAVTAWNAAGESPMSAEVQAIAAAANFNPLRINGVVLFAGELFYEPVAGDWKAGSTITVSASDATALSVKMQGNTPIVYGTFATAGAKTLTFTETPSSGSPNVSTQAIEVVAKPSASYADVKASAQAIKARMDAKPTYTDTPVAITDNAAMPSGYTASLTYFLGQSAPPTAYSAVTGFRPPETYITVTGYDPVERKAFVQTTPLATVANGVLRQRLFKQTWVLPIAADGGQSVQHFIVRYSDDDMATWKEAPDPVYTKYQSGSHFYKIDPGVAAPAAGRIWEVEFSAYSQLANYSYAPGFGYENGETPQAVVDNSPIMSGLLDSFGAGIGTVKATAGMFRRAARAVGLVNLWNGSIPTYRWTLPRTKDEAIGVDLIGDNVIGLGGATMPPRTNLAARNVTINDFGQNDVAQAQAMFINACLRERRLNPFALILWTVGLWSPQDRIPAALYNAIKAAMDYVASTDKGFRFNDGVAAGWAVAQGGTGSSPHFFANNNFTVTGSTTGTVLTVTAGGGIEPGMYLYVGNTYKRARIYKQLTGTTGGAGTYQLDVVPEGGDIASATLGMFSEDYVTAYPVHPNPAGHLWMGDRLADGIVALVNDIVA